jgi:hypothetical protein
MVNVSLGSATAKNSAPLISVNIMSSKDICRDICWSNKMVDSNIDAVDTSFTAL